MYQLKLHSNFNFDTMSWNLDRILIRSPLSSSGTLLSSVILLIKKKASPVYQIVSHNEVYTLDDMSKKLVTKFIHSVCNMYAQMHCTKSICKIYIHIYIYSCKVNL